MHILGLLDEVPRVRHRELQNYEASENSGRHRTIQKYDGIVLSRFQRWVLLPRQLKSCIDWHLLGLRGHFPTIFRVTEVYHKKSDTAQNYAQNVFVFVCWG